jgi:hypothetical protein
LSEDTDSEQRDEGAYLQAITVLIDADLTDAERAAAFADMVSTLLGQLNVARLRYWPTYRP